MAGARQPVFLALDDVLALHQDQISRYGGAAGIRDIGLLQSAIAAPAVTFDGALLHRSLAEMAAAYLYHLSQNHPFIDGNKRTALAAALVFLWINGHRVRIPEDDLYAMAIGVAGGRVSKADIAVFFARHRTGST